MRRLGTAILLTVSQFLAVGCEYEPRMHMDVPGMHPLKIQLLGFEGCPGATVLEERLHVVVEQAEIPARIEYVDLQALPVADSRRGWGSPTILVDGIDLYGQPEPGTRAMSCRVYNDGWPSCAELTSRLHGQLIASSR